METPDENLRDALTRLLQRADGRTASATMDAGYDQLHKRRMIHADAVGEILDAVKAAGYSRPPAGDLRAQLLKLGRELKAETWDRGHSWTDDAEERAREVRAEIKSDIGRAILDALEGS